MQVKKRPRRTNRRKNKGPRSGRNRGINRRFREDLMGHNERLPYLTEGFENESLYIFRGLIVPDHFYTHLKYSIYSQTLLPAAGVFLFAFRGNDCFDPDFTGVGNQPLGFDQLTALWSKFRVHRSRIKIKPVAISQTGQICVGPSLSSSAPSTMELAMQTPYFKMLNLPSTVMMPGLTLSNQIETRKIFGYPNITQDDVFVGNSSSSPASVFYWIIHSATFDSVTTGTYRADVELTYDVEFFGRLNLTQS